MAVILFVLIPMALLVAALAFRRRLTRRRVIVGLVVFVLASVGVVTWSVATGAGSCIAVAAKIQLGGLRASVLELMGPPSKSFTYTSHDIWYFHDGMVIVTYSHGVVSRRVYQQVDWQNRPRYWFGLVTDW